MLSPLAKQETMTITAVGVLLSAAALLLWWWWLIPVIALATIALLAFFRDTDRRTPTQRGVMTAPSDGRISSVHELKHYGPLDGPATCIRIFMSVFDGHINYSPYHSEVASIAHKDGAHLNTLKPESAEDNESNLIVLVHPTRGYPMAAVRQVAGMLARTIVCSAHEGQVLQRGQRIGLIKLGSTTELYIAHDLAPQVQVRQGQKVVGGVTVLAQITPKEGAAIVARPEREASDPKPGESEAVDNGDTAQADGVEEEPVEVEA
ncbi:MAG: phosphatidylserine decarboxylase [Planctomycetota bacterium]